MPVPPVVMTIAGSDSGGGAGIQADLMAIRDLGGFGVTVVTALTAQNTQGVTHVVPVEIPMVRAQFETICADMRPAAVKIGMLATAALVREVTHCLAALPASVPVVLDPVMVATSGDRLLDHDAVQALGPLMSRATLVTPNLPEMAVIQQELPAWAEALTLLVTGGDADTAEVVDRLHVDGHETTWRTPRVAGGPFHGTGCTLSAAIACHLAHGLSLEASVETSIAYVQDRLRTAFSPGQGSQVLGLRH
ncbi:MAG: bifunctional hydroxymethylpyrimidine kinase/phosphomethylpyrimidine kinase [Myxococcota bacterium]